MGPLSRPIRPMSSTLRNTTPTSRPPLPEKLPMLTQPGKLDTMDKRDSHSIPQERHGLLTCQTMLLKTQTSTSRPQLQSRRSWPMPPREKPPLKPSLLKEPSQLQEPPQLPQLKVPPLPQLPQPPQLLSFNSTRAETS